MASVSTLAAVAERLAQGERLQPADAEIVLGSHDLVTIGVMADEIRRQRHGRDLLAAAEKEKIRSIEQYLSSRPSAPVQV